MNQNTEMIKPTIMNTPKSSFQLSLPLVTYEIEHEVIHQRVKDGYINATAMCKASGKLIADW